MTLDNTVSATIRWWQQTRTRGRFACTRQHLGSLHTTVVRDSIRWAQMVMVVSFAVFRVYLESSYTLNFFKIRDNPVHEKAFLQF